jgi:hypothetical protein
MKIYPNKKPANYSFERGKTCYHCATFYNEIHPRENNLILIPSGQTNKIIFLLGNTTSLCITYQILITPLVSSNSSYPIIIDVMSYKGQKDYTSCKVQSHTTTPLLNQRKGEFTGCNTFNQNK